MPGTGSEIVNWSELWWLFALIALMFILFTWVQISLSKSEGKWIGLIMPAFFIIAGLIATLYTASYSQTMTAEQAWLTFLIGASPGFFWLIVYAIVRLTRRKTRK